MPATHAQETCTRNLCKKLALKIWREFITVSCTTTTGRPITLHGLCHVLDRFCAGTELCSIACKKLVQEKTCSRLTDTRSTRFLSMRHCHLPTQSAVTKKTNNLHCLEDNGHTALCEVTKPWFRRRDWWQNKKSGKLGLLPTGYLWW